MIIPFLSRFWPYIAVALLAFTTWGALKYAGHESLRADKAVQSAKDTIAVANQERADREANDAIAAKSAKDAEDRRQKFNQKRNEVSRAKPTDDGPLSRVLRDTLNELREPGTEADKSKS